jgi:uncharacterized protein with PIN domain
MPNEITMRFYGELNDFLPVELHRTSFCRQIKKARSIKDLIESIGAPHTEIDLIIVNGESVDFNYLIEGGEYVSVYPAFRSLDLSPLKHNQPGLTEEPRFVLDVHLGRLAAYLRMLGFDTLYRNDSDDPTLADISVSEQRILLTCDRLLLMRKQIIHGYFVRERNPQKQLLEILSRFRLYSYQKPFSRCMHCNGITQSVSKQQIKDRLLPKTRKYYDEFFQCEACDKIYWKGSHYLKMQAMVDEIKSDNTLVSSH